MITHPMRGKGQSTFFDVAHNTQPRLGGTTSRPALTLGTRAANIGRPLSHRRIYGICGAALLLAIARLAEDGANNPKRKKKVCVLLLIAVLPASLDVKSSQSSLV
jgi:hypothetical protein